MRKPIAAILAGLLSCSSVVAAEPALLLPSAVGVPEKKPAQRLLALETLREEIRIASRDGRCRRLLSSRLRRTRAGWSDIPYGSVSLSAQAPELPGAQLHAAMAAFRSVPAAAAIVGSWSRAARVR